MAKFEPESLPEITQAELELAEELAMQSAGARAERDAWPGRDQHVADRLHLCARRLEHGGWCMRTDVHDLGSCAGRPRVHGPEKPPPERRIMSEFRRELSQKYDTKRDQSGTSPAERWIAAIEKR